MAGKPIGTIFVELDLDPSNYIKSQQRILKDAKIVVTDIETNYKNLGIKSSREFDLLRARAENAYQGILHSSKATANDIVRAEQAKNDQLRSLNDQQFGHHGGLLETLKKNWLLASATIYGAMRVMRSGWEMMEQAADYQERINSLDALGRQYGMTGQQIVASMKDASRGLVSMSEAADMAASSLNLSLSPKQMIEFTRVSESLTDVIGGSIPEAFNRMTIAAASGRTMTLAQMGIIVDLDKAYKDYAESMGRTKDALSDAEKQQIRLNVILDAAKAKVDALGEPVDTARDKMDRFVNIWKDLKLEVGNFLLGPATDFLQWLNDIVQGLKNAHEQAEILELKRLKEELALYRQGVDVGTPLDLRWAPIGEIDPNVIADYERKIKEIQDRWKTTTGPAIRKAGIPIGEEPTKAGKKTEAELWMESEFKAYAEVEKANEEFAKKQLDIDEKNWELRNKLAIKGYADTLKAGEKWLEDDAKAKEDAAKEEERLRAKQTGDRLTAYKDLYKDLRGYENDYYSFQKDLVFKQEEDYRKLLIDKNTSAQEAARIEQLLARRTAEELRRIDEQKVLRSNNFFAGMKVAMDQNYRDMVRFGQAGADVFNEFAKEAQAQLSDNLFNFMTGRFDELGLKWNDLWESMLRTLTDKVAEMAVEAAAAEIFDWATALFAAEGLWKVPGEGGGGVPVIAHPGEMIIPADIAEQFRAISGLSSFAQLADNVGPVMAAFASMQGGKIPGIMSFVEGFAEHSGKTAAIGTVMALTGKISLTDLVTGVFSPQAWATAALKGGIPKAFADVMGMMSFSEKGFMLSMLAPLVGLHPLLGIPLGLLGMLGMEALQGLFPTTTTKMTWSDAIAYASQAAASGGWGAYGGPASATGGAAAAGGGGGGGAASSTGWAAGYKYGGIATGPESGYWARLHGTEKITPLRNGRDPGGSITINAPLVNIGGNLIAKKQDFDEFVEKIEYALDKRAKRVYAS